MEDAKVYQLLSTVKLSSGVGALSEDGKKFLEDYEKKNKEAQTINVVRADNPQKEESKPKAEHRAVRLLKEFMNNRYPR